MIVVLLWGMVACDDRASTAPAVDWVSFLNTAASELQDTSPEVSVRYAWNGDAEGMVTDSVDWKGVFEVFLKDSIPGFSLQRNYKRASYLTNTDSFVHWELPKPGRRPFAVRLGYVRGTDSLIYVQIVNKTDNLVYASFQEAVYRRNDSLLIRGYNKLRWRAPDSYEQLIRFKR
jgi:hypothetical protein